MNTKNIKKQQISKLRTEKIWYWIFCALITTETLKFKLWVTFILLCSQSSTKYKWMIFGLKISSEYQYEYHYSVSTIRLSFEYQAICSPLSWAPGQFEFRCIIFELFLYLVIMRKSHIYVQSCKQNFPQIKRNKVK